MPRGHSKTGLTIPKTPGSKVVSDEIRAIGRQTGNELRKMLFSATGAVKVVDDEEDLNPVGTHSALEQKATHFPWRAGSISMLRVTPSDGALYGRPSGSATMLKDSPTLRIE